MPADVRESVICCTSSCIASKFLGTDGALQRTAKLVHLIIVRILCTTLHMLDRQHACENIYDRRDFFLEILTQAAQKIRVRSGF